MIVTWSRCGVGVVSKSSGLGILPPSGGQVWNCNWLLPAHCYLDNGWAMKSKMLSKKTGGVVISKELVVCSSWEL